MARFTLPRDIYHGKGALENLKTLQGKRAIICVGGGSMKRGGFLQRAEDYLKEAGMEVLLYEGIESDPSVETVMKGAAAMEEFQAGLDRCHRRRFSDRRGQGNVDQIRISGYYF
jgi:alcohol dehydrogenase class IV